MQPLVAQPYIFNRAAIQTGKQPASVTATDFNGDGISDLAVANFADNTVSVLIGKPDGGFAAQAVYATGTSPEAIVTGDFNGDGKPDMAVLNVNARTISVLSGNGDGTFCEHMDYAVGESPSGIVAGDFDGDQKQDLAVSNAGDNAVSILYGNGDGSFQQGTTVAVGNYPLSVATGDLNGDGRADLVTSNLGDATVTVLLSGTGRIFGRTDFASAIEPERNSSSLLVADFNRDGKPDVVISDDSHLLPGGGSSRLLLMLGNGDGTLQSPKSVAQFSDMIGSNIIAGDFDDDGNLDLSLGTGGSAATIKGKGDGTFYAPVLSPVASPRALATADFNHDGFTDIAVVSSAFNSVDVSLGNGDGTFTCLTSLAFGTTVYGPNSAVSADFNGDGRLDLAVAEDNFPAGQISVRLGNGDGTFQSVQASPLISSASNNGGVLRTGDFNGDGKADLLLMDDYFRGFQALMGKGDGTFLAAADTLMNVKPESLAVGDLNRDSRTDVVVTTNGSGGMGTVTAWLSKGDGTFQYGASYNADVHTTAVVADVNQDGTPDLLLTSSGGLLRVMLGNGDGTFRTPITAADLNLPGSATVADVNADGKPDIVVPTYQGIAFLAGNGDGTFRPAIYSNPTYQFRGFIVGDFDGDGKLDLVSSTPSNIAEQASVLMLGNGDGTFGPPVSYAATGIPVGIIAADFNSDGRTDLALPNQALAGGHSVVSLYLSTTIVSTPQFKVTAANASTTINAGADAIYNLQITPYNGFSGTVNFTCSGLPAGTFCSISPLTLTGNAPVPFTLVVRSTARTTTGLSSAPANLKIRPVLSSTFAMFFVAGTVLTGIRARRSCWLVLLALLLVAAVIGCASCGGSKSVPVPGGNTVAGTPSGSYSFTLTASSGTVTHNNTLVLTIR